MDFVAMGYIYAKQSMRYPNPWDFPHKNTKEQEDKSKATLEYYNLNEIAMGGPLRGNAKIIFIDSKEIQIPSTCGGPAIWAQDGSQLAIPIWEKDLFIGVFQRIGIIDLKNQTLIKYKEKFSILDLRSFKKNFIRGYDSPIHKTKSFKFDCKNEPIHKTVELV